MSRAADVFIGVCVISLAWLYAFASIPPSHGGWALALDVGARVLFGCFATGPVYREYLK